MSTESPRNEPHDPKPLTPEQLRQAVHDNYPLDIVFNHHSTGADALESVSQVSDGAIVFIEGYGLGYNFAPFAQLLEQLLHTELTLGKDSDEYATQRTLVMQHVKADQYRPAHDENDFSLYRAVQIEALLEKECTVLPVDYSPEYAADMPLGGEQNRQLQLTPEFVASTGVDQTLDMLRGSIVDQMQFHYHHEAHATTQMYKYLSLLATHDPNNAQQREVVAIYGASHIQSFVDTIESMKYDDTSLLTISSYVQLADIQPNQYIPPHESLEAALPGQVTLAALQQVVLVEETIAENKQLADEVLASDDAAKQRTQQALQLLYNLGKYRETGDQAYQDQAHTLLQALTNPVE